MNLRCAETLMQKAKYELKIIEDAQKLIQIEHFIETRKIEACLVSNDDLNTRQISSLPVIVSDVKNCIHGSNNEKNSSHISYIHDFISKFSPKGTGKDRNLSLRITKFLKEDINRGEAKHQINKIIENYLDLVRKQVKDPSNKKLFGEIKEKEADEILEKIENYILRHIYKYIYPTLPNQKDNDFYEITRKLEWIGPEHLEIKKLYVNQLKFAEKYIKKMDQARSVSDKLKCIHNAYVTMNNTVKFISNKDDDAGQDELTPLFQYILIKSHPQNLFTNINYIKCLLSEADSMGPRGFYVSQMESASSFIFEIDHTQLRMSKEEFDSKVKIALDKYNREKHRGKNVLNEDNKRL